MLKTEHPTDYLKEEQHTAKQRSNLKRFKRSDSDPQLGSSSNTAQDSNIDENEEFFDAEESLEDNHIEVDHQPGTSNNERDKSVQEKEEKAKEQLTVFIKAFINDFTIMLAAHHVISKKRASEAELRSAIKKELKIGVTGALIGSAIAGSVAIGSTTAGGATVADAAAKAISPAITAIIPSASASTRALTSLLNISNQKDAHKITKAFENVPQGKLGEILSEAAGEIFHSFESQFMSVTGKAGDKMAMEKLAEDAAYRALKYIAKKDNNEPISSDLLSKGIILGESKGMLKHGCMLQNQNGKDLNTGELYGKAGLVTNSNKYYKKLEVGNTNQYGYRLLLEWEKKDNVELAIKLNTEYEEVKPPRGTEYKHLLKIEDIKKESDRILKEMEEAKPATKGDIEKIIGQVVRIPEGQASKQPPKNIKFDLRSPVENFIGREEELATLHEKLGQGVTAITQKSSGLSTGPQASVSGLGGIGKTQLAREYAKRHSEEYDNNIMWINAENELSISGSFERLASKLGIAKKDVDGDKKKTHDLVQEIYEHFGEAKSLFTFDNVENSNEIKEYLLKDLAGNKPSILIASRYRNWKNTKVKVLDLNVFTDEEAKQFIKQELDINDNSQDEEVERLAKKLEKLPLALAQAVAYIKQSQIINQNFGISDYLQKYNEKLANVKALLGSQALKGSNDPYAETVLTTWKVTLDKIRAETNGEKAIEILNIMAYFNPENIPNEMFVKLIDAKAPQEVSRMLDYSSHNHDSQIFSEVYSRSREIISSAIQLLQSYSMINQGAEQDQSNIYRLVQKVVRIGLKQENKEEDILNKANILIEKFRYTTDETLFIPYEEYNVLLKAAKLQYGTEEEKSSLISEVLNNIRINGDVNLLGVFLDQLKENIADKADYLSYLSTTLTYFITYVSANSDASVNFATEVISYIKNAEEEKKITKVDLLRLFEKKYNIGDIRPGGEEEATIDELISELKSSHSDDQAEQKRLEDIEKEIKSIKEKREELKKLKECAIQGRDERKKRSAENECLFDSKDVDKFNEAEEQHKRNPNKIRINSEKLIDHLKDASEERQDQLIELAGYVEVTGNAKESVGELVKHHKIKSHLQKVSKLSGQINSALMGENIGDDITNGDYKDVAVNAGLIGGGAVLGKASDKILAKGVALEADKKLLSRSLKVASPFLKRGTAGFFAYNLIQNIKEYKAGNKEALPDMILNGVFVGLDAAQAGVEAAEFLEVIAGVAEFTGPIGEAIATAIFLGTAIYHAEKQVEEIEKHVHLTRGEELWEGLRAAVGLDPSKETEKRIEVKEHNNQSVKKAIEFLKNNTNFSRYVFPVMEEKNMCLIEVDWVNVHSSPIVSRTTSSCNSTFQSAPDSVVNLNDKVNYEGFEEVGFWHIGKRAIIVKYSLNRTGNNNLIALGEGKDIAVGALDSPNIFIVNNGHKNYTGGNEGDTFAIQGSNIRGILSGGGGIDTLNLREFETNNDEFALLESNGALCSKTNQVSSSYAVWANGMRCTNNFGDKNSLSTDNIEQVYGRKYERDVIFPNKESEYIAGLGGKNSIQPDEVHLKINSNKNPTIVLRPYTQVSYGRSDNFIDSVNYIVPRDEEGEASVYPFFNLSIQHRLHFDYPVSSLRGINVGEGNITFNLFDQQKEFNVTISDTCRDFTLCIDRTNKKDYPSLPRNASYTFQDNTEIKILNRNNFYAEQNVNKTVEEIISEYSEVANRLNMTMLFKLPNNETVLVGHGAHEVMHNNPSYTSHLVGNGGENVYKIGHGPQEFTLDELPIPGTVIYDVDEENSIDTIDLRNLIQKKPNGTEFHGPQVLISEQENDLILSSFLKSQNNETREYFEVVLQDGVNWSHNVDVVINGSHMKIDFNGTNYQLKPLPLIFKSDYKYIVIQPSDIEKENEIIIGKEVDNYTFARLSNDLVITNAFDQDLRESKHCSIILKDFYLESKIRTLSIKFVDKEIILKDHIEQINNATNFDTLQKEHNNTRSTILNIPDSQESTTTVNPEITTHRHQHHHGQNATAHQRGRRAISVDGVLANNNDPVFFAGQNNAITGIKHEETNGAARPSSLINDVSNWVKSSISRWIASTTSIPQQVDARASKGSWASSMGQRIYDYFTNGSFFQDNADYVNANLKQTYEEQMPIKFKPKDGSTILEMGDHYLSQVDFNGTITLLDLLIRKITGKKPISTEGKSMSLLEAQGHAFNIREKFKKVVEQAALESDISMHRLNIDYITIQEEITKKVMSSNFDEIAEILKSNIEKACPGRETGCPGKLSQKKFDTFITTFNDEISVALNQSTQQISDRNSALEVKAQQEPKSHLSNISVQGHLTQAKAKLIS